MSNFYPVNLLLFLLPFLISTPTPQISPKLEKGGLWGAQRRDPTILTQERLEEAAGVAWAQIL